MKRITRPRGSRVGCGGIGVERRSGCWVWGWGSSASGPAQPYVRTENGQSERFRWVFEGIPSDAFGAFGDLLGGAAGFEMDHVDARLGTPAETFVLATASGFDPGLSASVVEDMVLTRPASEPRADLTITDFAGGGSVFATGSSCWATSLLANGGRQRRRQDHAQRREPLHRHVSRVRPGPTTRMQWRVLDRGRPIEDHRRTLGLSILRPLG